MIYLVLRIVFTPYLRLFHRVEVSLLLIGINALLLPAFDNPALVFG